jgi:hypothetical protein
VIAWACGGEGPVIDEGGLVQNRITRYFVGLDALMASETAVSAEHPVSLWIDRDVLAAVLEENLANLERNREVVAASRTGQDQLDRMVAERRAFLRWVRAWGGASVFVGLYPHTECDPDPDVPDVRDCPEDRGSPPADPLV